MASKRMVSSLFALAFTAGCQMAESADSAARGERVFTDYCQPCHTPTGGGNASIGAPAIAGLSDWYVDAQLRKFQLGYRGQHFDDIEGMRMRPMALALRSEGEIEAVSTYVAAMPVVHNVHTVQGDIEAGEKHYATCAACHGPEAKGNATLNAPSLVQADDWYLERQIGKFQSGVRGARPGDTTGAQMAPMAATLKDDQATKDVVAYIKSLSTK
jgi:uncharacterized protein